MGLYLLQLFLKKPWCLLTNIFTKVHKPTTPSQRFKKTLFLFKFIKIKKFFKIFLKNNAGRNNAGRITVFSKGIKKKINSIPLISPFLGDNKLSVITTILRNKKKLMAVARHNTGSFSDKPLISGMLIGQYIFSSNLPQNFWVNKLPGNLIILKFLTKYSIFSNVFIQNFRRFALSNGTFCQILEIFTDFNLIKVTLPSKTTKLISGWSFAVLGKNSQENHNYCRVGKAGLNYVLGKKPKVRGVARNPVDHPHGGRTKTNKPEVSIWGWVAKRNK